MVMGARVPEHATTLPDLLSYSTVWFDDSSDSHSARLMHIDLIGSTSDGSGISAVLADTQTADDLGTPVQFADHKASLAVVASIIAEHRRGLAEVGTARLLMDMFRLATVGEKCSPRQKFCSCGARLGTSQNVAIRTVHSVTPTECTIRRPVSWLRPCDERVLQNRARGPTFLPFDDYSYPLGHLAVQRLDARA